MTSLKTKAQLCWNIVRGRPTAYRLHVLGGLTLESGSGGMLVDCFIESSPDIETLKKIIIDHHECGERILGEVCKYCPPNFWNLLIPLVYVSTK